MPRSPSNSSMASGRPLGIKRDSLPTLFAAPRLGLMGFAELNSLRLAAQRERRKRRFEFRVVQNPTAAAPVRKASACAEIVRAPACQRKVLIREVLPDADPAPPLPRKPPNDHN